MDRRQTVQAALDFIEGEIQSELTAEKIAENAGYSALHFGRLFARETGVTVMTYHDKRDHGDFFGGKLQIDICVPIKKRSS